MDEAQVQQIVDELLSSLEPLETQSSALLQFLKAKGLATDEELAPFLDQAGNTANVRWRAVKVRTAALISNAMKSAGQPTEPIATNNPLIAAKPVAEMKPRKEKGKEQENAEPSEEQKTAEERTKDANQPQEGKKETMAQKQKTETASTPEQRTQEKSLEETPKSYQSIPESDEALNENRATNSDAPEAPSKNDTREAA